MKDKVRNIIQLENDFERAKDEFLEEDSATLIQKLRDISSIFIRGKKESQYAGDCYNIPFALTKGVMLGDYPLSETKWSFYSGETPMIKASVRATSAGEYDTGWIFQFPADQIEFEEYLMDLKIEADKEEQAMLAKKEQEQKQTEAEELATFDRLSKKFSK